MSPHDLSSGQWRASPPALAGRPVGVISQDGDVAGPCSDEEPGKEEGPAVPCDGIHQISAAHDEESGIEHQFH